MKLLKYIFLRKFKLLLTDAAAGSLRSKSLDVLDFAKSFLTSALMLKTRFVKYDLFMVLLLTITAAFVELTWVKVENR